jgi:4-hydroxy-tetrahydrodipicolinate reductase
MFNYSILPLGTLLEYAPLSWVRDLRGARKRMDALIFRLIAERRAGAARKGDIPVSSIRTGSVPGTHTLLLDGGFEQIRVEHVARDRRVFADGALTAAGWLIGKHGIFTMTDFLMDVGLP